MKELFTKRKKIEEPKILLIKDGSINVEIEEPKILLVEDGSIDIDDLAMFIADNDLKIKIVVYRQGSVLPCFLE